MHSQLTILIALAALARGAEVPLTSLIPTVGLSPDSTCGNQVAGLNKGYICDKNAFDGGRCCSEYGYCGNGNSFCGQGCQKEFGECGGNIQTVCGPKHGGKKCSHGDCCNKAGFCGTGAEFCPVPGVCQRGFGQCDSDMSPVGPSTRNDKRNKKSKVPYGKEIFNCTQPGTIALTFDDGPNQYTEELLNLLKAWGVKATFMVAGNTNGRGPIDTTGDYPWLLKRMVVDGHQIGSHTWSHPNLSQMSSCERKEDLYKNERAIANVIGRYPTYMRAPYGDCTEQSGCVKDLKDLGYHQIQETLDSYDWKYSDDIEKAQEHLVDWFNKFSGDSAIVCQHDTIAASTTVLVNTIIQKASSRGWKFVTVGECLGDPRAGWYNGKNMETWTPSVNGGHAIGMRTVRGLIFGIMIIFLML